MQSAQRAGHSRSWREFWNIFDVLALAVFFGTCVGCVRYFALNFTQPPACDVCVTCLAFGWKRYVTAGSCTAAAGDTWRSSSNYGVRRGFERGLSYSVERRRLL